MAEVVRWAAALLVLVSASACGRGNGSGVTVNGKATIGSVENGSTYGYVSLFDEPGSKDIYCRPVEGRDGSISLTAGVFESDIVIPAGFDVEVVFDPDTLEAESVGLTAREGETTFVGDDCEIEIRGYQPNGALFDSLITCPSSNGGDGPELAWDGEFSFCQLAAPR